MAPADDLFKLVDDLAQQRPFQRESVGRAVGKALREVPAASNPYFQVFESERDEAGTVTRIELRIPTATASRKDGLAVLSINPGRCIGEAAVLARYGGRPEVRPADPNAPYELYYEYKRPWGALRFAFARGTRCLIAATIDATEPAQASIGSATMDKDGAIVLDLRAEGPGGLVGDARFLYPPGHKQYAEILRHLGGLRPGEVKLVPPWPDEKPARSPGSGIPLAQEKFALTDKPQDAVFVTTYGWTGGMGQPVLDPQTGLVKRYRDRPVFVSGELSDLLRSRLPESWSGRLYIVVTANIRLVSKTQRNSSIPGFHFETFWQVQLNRLDDVKVHVVP